MSLGFYIGGNWFAVAADPNRQTYDSIKVIALSSSSILHPTVTGNSHTPYQLRLRRNYHSTTSEPLAHVLSQLQNAMLSCPTRQND